MNNRDKLNRRDLIMKTAGVAGSVSALSGSVPTPAHAQISPPEGFDAQEPVVKYWERQLREVANIDLATAAPELANDAVKERHQIYCLLLMALISRFWNGNKRGPLGVYPRRVKQMATGQNPQSAVFRYRGDMATNDPLRVSWDRYLGHNIACLAVDGKGEIIDFDFNHTDLFRNSADHAESRLVRRLGSITDVFDKWKTGDANPKSLNEAPLVDITIYTSLESCAQCWGTMSLSGVKQVIYLQNDFTSYMIGNILFNLSYRGMSPVPIPASAVGLQQFKMLNEANLAFVNDIQDAKNRNDSTRSFFISPDKTFVDYDPSITSFLCTDKAYEIFQRAGDEFTGMQLSFRAAKFPNEPDVWDNQRCIDQARRFFHFADVGGFRGSPHKS